MANVINWSKVQKILLFARKETAKDDEKDFPLKIEVNSII
jgi:hypothetical protein